MSKQNDRALRIYNEVLGLERLHYGIWLADDPLSTEKLKEAQQRFEDYLVDKLPDSVNRILDVGCGTGILAKKLIAMGYDVEGLSPDISQKNNFVEHINATFHHTTFDEFSAVDKYDCLIMSESAQYIRIAKIFENAEKSLKKDGYLMICDYFVLPNATGEQSKSGHDYEVFKEYITNNNFALLVENDITEQVTKTLDFGKSMVEKVFKAIDIGTEKIRVKHPNISKLVLRLFRKKIAKLKQQTQLLDSDEFKLNKTYRFMLLQLQS